MHVIGVETGQLFSDFPALDFGILLPEVILAGPAVFLLQPPLDGCCHGQEITGSLDLCQALIFGLDNFSAR